MFFDDQGLTGQFLDIGIADAEAVAQVFRSGFVAHALAGDIRIHHADLLAAEGPAQDGMFTLTQGRFVDVEFVRIDRALHHVFTQTVTGGDEYGFAETGLGIEGEQHAGSADIGSHHQLDAGREKDIFVFEAVMHPVGDGAVVI